MSLLDAYQKGKRCEPDPSKVRLALKAIDAHRAGEKLETTMLYFVSGTLMRAAQAINPAVNNRTWAIKVCKEHYA